jgi:hypothetical protein
MGERAFNDREKTLVEFLLIYYKNKIKIFADIILQKTPLSLRLLDWLVTNYAKKYNIIYPLYLSSGEMKYFNIYLDYKNQLKAYSKKFFDPFCRQNRILINIDTLNWCKYENNKTSENQLITTVGQLNFFRWFIDNKILDYALNNIRLVDNDMTITMKNKDKYKRNVLSPSAIKGMCVSDRSITINFKY